MSNFPNISGADSIKGNLITLTQSHESAVSFFFSEDGNYNLEIVGKRNTKNLLFIHNIIQVSQKIKLFVRLEEGAQVFCIALLHTESQANLHVDFEFIGADRSQIHFVGLHTNCGQSHVTITSTAEGSHAVSNLACIGIGKGHSSQTISIKNTSLGMENMGSIKNRSVLFDAAMAKQEGEPIIQKTGKGSEYHLEQKALILGEKARVISRPLLSVANNQVKASHSASVSSFPEEDLFYLESRGLNKESALQLAVEGFVHELFEDIPSENMKACLIENMKKFMEN